MPKTIKIKGGKGSSADQLEIVGTLSTSVKLGKGGDVVTDRGGDNDQVRGGGGNDTVIFHYSGNESGINDYDGDKGTDTLVLQFSRSQWMQLNPLIQSDLDSYISHLAGGNKKGFIFQSVGIEASEFEVIRLFVDDQELSPEDDTAIAVDDTALLDENTVVSGSVLLNDQVPDLVRGVALLGEGVERGSLILDADGSFQFETLDAFEELALNEPAGVDFSYRVTDATGDSSQATMFLTINGQNDAPLLAAAEAVIEEDGPTISVNLANLGSDIDSDDTGDSLVYSINSAPIAGSASITNNSLNIQSGGDFQQLAVGESSVVTIGVTATDRHGAAANNEVTVTVIGTNDLPILTTDYAEVIEDNTVVVDVLANDTDIDATDILSIVSATNGSHGLVTLVDGDDEDELPNDSLLYTPHADFSGSDEFSYTVTDSNGGVVAQTVTIDVAAKADTPVISHQIIAGATASQFTVRVSASQTDLDGSEVIDRIVLAGKNPDGNTFDLAPFVDRTSYEDTGSNGNLTADFHFTLPSGSSSDFEVTATAFSKEIANDDEASSSVSFSIETAGSSNSNRYTFNAENQSIWGNGNPFNYNGTFNANGSLDESADIGTSIIGPIDIRVAGVGATTHFSTVVRTGVELDLGLESRFGVSGGEVDAILNYNTEVTSTFNKSTDVLSIQTLSSNSLIENGFTASTPNINFEQALTDFGLSMDFALYVWGYLHIHYGTGTARVVNMPNINDGLSVGSPDVGIDLGGLFGADGLSLVRYDGNALHLLEGLYTQTEYAGSKEDALGNELVSWLLNSQEFSNNSDYADWSSNQVIGSESRTFASLTFDLDGIAAHLLGKPNPVHQSLDAVQIGPFHVGAEAELLDVDLVLSSAYRQDNFLQPGKLNGTLVFEDESRINFVFGDTINVSDASLKDINGDGQIDYSFEMRPDASFQTNAFIDLSLRDEIDILSVNISGGVDDFGSIGLNRGPIEEYNGTVINQYVPIQLVGNSFALNVGTVESGMMVI